MLPSRAKWTVSGMESGTTSLLQERLGLSSLAARLLAARGIQNPEQAHLFLNAGAELAHDPYLLGDMRQAVDRIRTALSRGERIRIYGDYDADGVSSTSLMVHLLRLLGATFDSYIPHRVQEGYGLNRGAMDAAKAAEVDLIITVDTGISAKEEVAYAQSLGIDVIVTDHHEPPEELPVCCAVINPKKPDCPYPFKHLAGVGVAFKLAHALLDRFPEELLEYAAIGTVADLMPLTGENRILVRLGIERMRVTSNPGLKALLAVAGIDRRQVNAGHVGFSLGPRINAGGRLDSADAAVKLLTTDDEKEAVTLAETLDDLNKERQRVVEEISAEAEGVVLAEDGYHPPKVLVVAQEGWNVGVIGIVASRLLETYYRPTIVLGIDPETGMAKGSARSIAGFDLYAALSECSDLLDHYGGHQAAAGMTLKREHLPELKARLNKLADEWLTDEQLVPVLQADLNVSLSEVSVTAIRELEKLGPFGMGNPSPRFVFSDLDVRERRTMGKEQQHLKLQLAEAMSQTAASIEAVGFRKSSMLERMSPAARVDIVGELSINEWNGSRRAQLLIQDLRVPHVQVFDWRGAGRIEDKLEKLGYRSPLWSGRYSDISASPGILLFGEGDLTLLPPGMAEQATIWCRREDGDIRSLHKGAEASFGAVQDLVLYTMPDSSQMLEEALRQAAGAKRIYAAFRHRSEVRMAVPGRDRFKQVYAALRAIGDKPVEAGAFAAEYSRRLGLPPSSITFIMEVFAELEFLERCPDGIRCNPSPGRRELTSSALYSNHLEKQRAEELLLYSSATDLHKWILPRLAIPNLLTEA